MLTRLLPIKLKTLSVDFLKIQHSILKKFNKKVKPSFKTLKKLTFFEILKFFFSRVCKSLNSKFANLPIKYHIIKFGTQ